MEKNIDMKKIKFIRRILIDNEFKINELSDDGGVQIHIEKGGVELTTNILPTRTAAYESLIDLIVITYYCNTHDLRQLLSKKSLQEK